MLRKVWELLGLVMVLVIALHLAIAALEPFLPLLGLVLLAIITGVLVKVAFFRRKFW